MSAKPPYYVIARDGGVPLLYGPFEDRYAANRHLRSLPDHWQRWTVRLNSQGAKDPS
jgi:hypothetical protein